MRARGIAPARPTLPPLTTAEAAEGDSEFERHIFAREYLGRDVSGEQFIAAEIEQCRFDKTTMPASMRRVSIADSEFIGSDWANVSADEGSMFRSVLSACRLTGLSWTAGTWRDVTVESVRANLAFFGHSKMQMVVFRDCEMTQVDFERVRLRNVLFEGCDLSGAQFSGAQMENVRFSDCRLINVRGVSGLKGATVQGGDLVGLATSLAREAGIAVEW